MALKIGIDVGGSASLIEDIAKIISHFLLTLLHLRINDDFFNNFLYNDDLFDVDRFCFGDWFGSRLLLHSLSHCLHDSFCNR